MEKPILVVLAAGMGSRYGGLKQMDPVGTHGEAILDYSVFDARRAGFETVVFIIKHSIEADFKAIIGRRIEPFMDVRYVYQMPDDLPEGYSVPDGREKPWGTGQALLAARDMINAPFALISSDDYYGPASFRILYDFLAAPHRDNAYCMVGYRLQNTVPPTGSVSRGICSADDGGNLITLVERRTIERRGNEISFTEDGGNTWTSLPPDTLVNMLMYGFQPGLLSELLARFPAFLDEALKNDPLQGEYLLPSVVGELLDEKKITVRVLSTPEKWYGVTYRADREGVASAMAEKTAAGLYPAPLWG